MSTQGVSDFARATATDLGHLIGQHFKIARLEIGAEARVLGRRAFITAVLVVLIAIGYSMALVGGALVIGGYQAPGIPLIYIGLAHSLGASVGLVLLPLRAPHSTFMGHTTTEVDRSLVALKDAMSSDSITPNSAENTHGR
jgi:hypothetical protein